MEGHLWVPTTSTRHHRTAEHMRDLANAKRSQSSSPAKDARTPSAVKTKDHTSGDPASHAFEEDRELIGLDATSSQYALG